MKNDLFAKRMKKYEAASQSFLMPRTPAIIRLDGKSFSTFTKSYNKPWDNAIIAAFEEVVRTLAKEISGCSFVYHQSDEISLILQDYWNLNTQGWFDYKIQKIVSVSSSIATAVFNSKLKSDKYACFDSRCFSLPKEEVANYFIWRQRDCIINSVLALAQKYFSHTQLHGKSTQDIKEMLLKDKNINWDEIPLKYQRGFVFKLKDKTSERKEWVEDSQIPLFGKNREYIQNLL